MRKLTLMTTLLSSLTLSPQVFSANQLYIETGLGTSQYSSKLNGSVFNHDASNSPSAKVLIGSRLTRSPHAWFELMYNYNAQTTFSDSTVELTSQMISTGVKLTSDQTAPMSFFVRSGIGKVFLSANSGSSINKNQYYFGGGISYRFENKRALNFEFQQFNVPDVDAGNYQVQSSAVFLTIKQDID